VCSTFSVTFAEAPPVEVWNVTWGGSGDYEGRAVATAGDFVYLAGAIGGVDAFLNKYDRDGNLLWNITWEMFPPSGEWYSDSVAMTMTKDSVYLAGMTAYPNNTDFDAFLNRYDIDGNLLWNITWSGPGCYAAFDAAASGDSVYVAGREGHKAFLSRYDGTDGSLIWNLTSLWMEVEGIAVGDHVVYTRQAPVSPMPVSTNTVAQTAVSSGISRIVECHGDRQQQQQ